MGRHAYLILAHHRPDLLWRLMRALDHPDNDIYVHLDAKTRYDMFPGSLRTKRAQTVLMPSQNVEWQAYSVVDCELKMLARATADGYHDRYHLLTGETYPLRTQDEIHAFFDEHTSEEYIHIHPRGSINTVDRVKYWHPLNKHGNRFIAQHKVKSAVRRGAVAAQKLMHVDCFKRFGMTYKQGLAYWSVTDGLAHHALDSAAKVAAMFKHAIASDEAFMQTIAFNSEFGERIPPYDGQSRSCLRFSTWTLESKGHRRPRHCLAREDLDMLLRMPALFALKFGGPNGHWLIDRINEERGITS